jgi:hypothetical protein
MPPLKGGYDHHMRAIDKKSWLLIRPIIVLAVFTFVVFPALYYGVDFSGTNPNWAECTYFSCVTVTTTGYGDVLPKGLGRVIACAQMFTGIGIISVWLSISITRFSSSSEG